MEGLGHIVSDGKEKPIFGRPNVLWTVPVASQPEHAIDSAQVEALRRPAVFGRTRNHGDGARRCSLLGRRLTDLAFRLI